MLFMIDPNLMIPLFLMLHMGIKFLNHINPYDFSTTAQLERKLMKRSVLSYNRLHGFIHEKYSRKVEELS